MFTLQPQTGILMQVFPYILTVVLFAFTGWFTTWFLLRILFRPAKPCSLAGFTIQGILPANQQKIAEKAGKIVSSHLFSFDALQEKFTGPENFDKLRPLIENHIDSFLRERLKEIFPMLAGLMGNKTINQLKAAFILELETIFPIIMKSYMANLEKDFDIEEQVTEKIASISMKKTEALIFESAKKQIIKLQLSGIIIGLLIGFIHILINTQFFT